MTVTESNTTTKDGKVVSIAGPVIDVEFPEDLCQKLIQRYRLTLSLMA